MQVFKLYFKIFNAHKGQLIMYLAIFMSVLFFAIIPNSVKQDEKNYTDSKATYAIFDEDNSELSKSLATYLDKTNKQVKIKDNSHETIQDELYARNVAAVITLKKGFHEATLNANGSAYVDMVTVANTSKAMFLGNVVDSYLSKIHVYLTAGYSVADAAAKAEAVLGISTPVNFPNGSSATGHSAMYYFFSYLVWILVCGLILAVSPTLNSINGEMTKRRINCSSYKFSKINMEINLSLVCTGIGVTVVLLAFASVVFSKDFFTLMGVLYAANLLAYSAIAVAFGLLISKLTSSDPITSMFANVISLGMAFLSGVFVPFELLCASVIKFAHFLPSYYYMDNLFSVERAVTIDYGTFFINLCIQLLFAVAIIIIATVIERNRSLAKKTV